MSPPADDGAVVRLVDLYTEQIKMGVQMAVIGKQLEQLPDHEARIRVLERWRYSLPVAALGALASAVLALASFLHH